MSEIAIRVEKLGKRYRIGKRENGSNGKTPLLRKALAPFGYLASTLREPSPEETLWALKDVSFEVNRGDIVGIIGRNGAGKSTLLKILTRITEPTEGWADLHGRVGALLEVGTGFHPELTGRENIYLSGTILGMKRWEIDRRLDQIVAFAELARFLDTPVKRYSSGMYVRLAFAVAAHLEPEILLVDEVLAVGDAAFQKKCIDKMGEVSSEGRTVLFVSHNMGAISSLTETSIFLKLGEINLIGPTTEVVSHYLLDAFGDSKIKRPHLEAYHRRSIIESPACFIHIWINDSKDEIPTIVMGESFIVYAELKTLVEIRGANVTLVLKRSDGLEVTRILSVDQDVRFSSPPGRHIIGCEVKDLPLTPGEYLITMGISQSPETATWDIVADYPLFRVEDRAGDVLYAPNRRWGIVHWDKVNWSFPN